MTGSIIVLAGVSSVGKTSTAEALQEAARDPWLHVGLDHFFSMFPHHWRDHPRGPGPGFWYEDSTGADGMPRARIRHGEAGARMLVGMRAAVNALLASGNDVILDEMPFDDSTMPAWRRELRASRSFWVLLTAPLDVLETRERARARGRKLGNARGHLDVDPGDAWDLVLDMGSLEPAQAAARISRACPFM